MVIPTQLLLHYPFMLDALPIERIHADLVTFSSIARLGSPIIKSTSTQALIGSRGSYVISNSDDSIDLFIILPLNIGLPQHLLYWKICFNDHAMTLKVVSKVFDHHHCRQCQLFNLLVSLLRTPQYLANKVHWSLNVIYLLYQGEAYCILHHSP